MTTATSRADRDGRSGRRAVGASPTGPIGARVEPPKQRRPALAALAIVLIVGGALGAALAAVRMDSRKPVLVAAHDIAPGTRISASDLTTVSVSADGIPTIPEGAESQVVGHTYAAGEIRAGTLIGQNMLTTSDPIKDGRAIVSVALDSSLSPTDQIGGGDLVEVVRTGGGQANSVKPEPITEALVLEVDRTSSSGGFGGGGSSSATAVLLVPSPAAADVIGASGAKAAGLALLKHDQPIDVELKVLQ